MPVTSAPVWQAKKSLRRQLSQERQCQACQPTPTRWPACQRPGTSLPTASITPTTSCPGTRGKVMPGHWPSLVKTSLWQTPQAWTLIRTDPGPGSGIGRSTSSRGPPGRETWATRIVAMRMFLSVYCGVTVGVTVSPGLLFVRLGNGHLPGVRPRRRVTRARREPKSAGFHGPPFGTNADDHLPLTSLGPVEGGDGIVEGRDVADVRPQSSVPYPLDEPTQLGGMG